MRRRGLHPLGSWQARLGVVGIAALVLAGLMGVGARPSAPPSPQAHAPIRYTQVAQPVGRASPGKGTTSTSVVYTPANIQSAYDYGGFAAGGAGTTIAIVDAYGDPALSSDVAGFDSKFGLSTVSLAVYAPDGAPTATNSNWAIETALDVEWAHASAPAAQIDLVVVPDASLQHLLDGVNAAVGLGPTSISMSWGAAETTMASYGYLGPYETALQTAASKGIALLASSGDNGAYNGSRPKQLQVNYPASSPEVMGVGGTTLYLSTSGAYGSESAWSDSGGGYSVEFKEPAYQTGAAIPDAKDARGVPDVAFDANPNTGVYVLAQGSWYAVGGTSVGSPNWAAIVADNAAGGSPSLNVAEAYGVYGAGGTGSHYAADFHDITSGNNGYYSAAKGWDAVTGLGTPNVSNLILNP